MAERERNINSPIADVVALYDKHLELLNRVQTSDYYFYTIDEDNDTEDKSKPYVSLDTVQTFYSSTTKTSEAFSKAQYMLAAIGREMPLVDLSLPQRKVLSTRICSETTKLIAGLRAINSARPDLGGSLIRRSERDRVLIKQFIGSINQEQPETLRETLRRYIPRFVTHPIPYPEEALPTEDQLDIASRWRNLTTKEAHYLIHPDRISEGIPLHIVFKIARSLERKDKADTGYALRVHGVSHLLAMEKEQSNLDKHAEMPFFTYMLSGIMPGSSLEYIMKLAKHSSEVKHITFDYEEALAETMTQTLQKFQVELEERRPGIATEFILQLRQYYPDQFSEMFASSIVNYAVRTRKIDVVKILQKLQEVSWPEFDQIFEYVQGQPLRRVIANDEVDTLLSGLPKLEDSEESTDLQQDIKELVGDEDSFSYTRNINRKVLKEGGQTFAIKIDLEPLSGMVYALLLCTSPKGIRAIPFKFSFSGESFSLPVLDESPTYPATVEQLKRRVGDIIHSLVERRRIDTKQSPIVTSQVDNSRQITQLPTSQLSREERKAQYQSAMLDEARRQKTRPTNPQEAKPLSGLVYKADPKEESQSHYERRITGLDYITVVNLLNAEGIVGIEPETFVNKIEHLVELANVSKKILGKRIDPEVLSQQELKGEQINLRQISWVLNGGVTQIRVYIEDAKQGYFILRGVMSKKSESQQTRYIRQLLLQIVRERKEQED
jgi:uncharacterized protein (UPF0335 family)